MGVYLVFVYFSDGKKDFGGYFTTAEKAKKVCDVYNEKEGNKGFANYINVTYEADDEYLIQQEERR